MMKIIDQALTLKNIQKSVSVELMVLGQETLERCWGMAKAELPDDLVPANNITQPGILDVRKELIGALVALDPNEYTDNPEAAVYKADNLLRLFNISSKS